MATNIADLLGGTLNIMLLDMGTSMTYAKVGKIRVLATSPLKRNPLTPDWPAVSEVMAGYDVNSWSALVGPAALPRDTAIVTNLLTSLVMCDFSPSGVIGMGTLPVLPRLSITSGCWRIFPTASDRRIARDANLEPM